MTDDDLPIAVLFHHHLREPSAQASLDIGGRLVADPMLKAPKSMWVFRQRRPRGGRTGAKTGSFRVAENPLGIDPSKGPHPKELEHWLLFALGQRGRGLGWREMSQRNIMCIREEKAGHCKHCHSLA